MTSATSTMSMSLMLISKSYGWSWCHSIASGWRECVFPYHKYYIATFAMKRVVQWFSSWASLEHIINFVAVCGSISFKNISIKSVRLRFFPFSLMGEACEWLAKFQRESITSWEELVTAFQVRLFTPSKITTLLEKHLKLQVSIERAYSWNLSTIQEVGVPMPNSCLAWQCVVVEFLLKYWFSKQG